MSRILVIDDEPSIREVITEILQSAGYEVETAREGQEGIDKHRDDPADLIITDLHMPGKNGLETLAELREDDHEAKLIAMSGDDTYMVETNLDSSRINGADRTFMKPFSIPELLEAIRELLEQS